MPTLSKSFNIKINLSKKIMEIMHHITTRASTNIKYLTYSAETVSLSPEKNVMYPSYYSHTFLCNVVSLKSQVKHLPQISFTKAFFTCTAMSCLITNIIL